MHVLSPQVSRCNYLVENLCSALTPNLKEEFCSIYREIKLSTKNPDLVIRSFQDRMETIPNITTEQVSLMLGRIHCSWLHQVFDQVVQEFVTILGCSRQNKSDLVDYFKKCLVHIARDLWRRPFLMFDRFDNYKICKNNAELDNIIRYAVMTTLTDVINISDCVNQSEIENEDLNVGEPSDDNDECEEDVEIVEDENEDHVDVDVDDHEHPHNDNDDDAESILSIID